jgi:hypothetical protein
MFVKFKYKAKIYCRLFVSFSIKTIVLLCLQHHLPHQSKWFLVPIVRQIPRPQMGAVSAAAVGADFF